MLFTSLKSKQGRNLSYKSKKRRCITVNSHINSSKSNNLDTSNSNNNAENSNLPRINVQTETSFNTLINLQAETDIQSSIMINNEIIDENNISEEISSHQNLAQLIDLTCDDNEKKNQYRRRSICHINSFY